MSLVEIYRVKVDPTRVVRLLEIHDQAVAEYQQQVPELEGIELVRLDGLPRAAEDRLLCLVELAPDHREHRPHEQVVGAERTVRG